MKTDILAGFQAGLETILVTSGVSQLTDIEKEPFEPNHVFSCAGDIDVI